MVLIAVRTTLLISQWLFSPRDKWCLYFDRTQVRIRPVGTTSSLFTKSSQSLQLPTDQNPISPNFGLRLGLSKLPANDRLSQFPEGGGPQLGCLDLINKNTKHLIYWHCYCCSLFIQIHLPSPQSHSPRCLAPAAHIPLSGLLRPR